MFPNYKHNILPINIRQELGNLISKINSKYYGKSQTLVAHPDNIKALLEEMIRRNELIEAKIPSIDDLKSGSLKFLGIPIKPNKLLPNTDIVEEDIIIWTKDKSKDIVSNLDYSKEYINMCICLGWAELIKKQTKFLVFYLIDNDKLLQ